MGDFGNEWMTNGQGEDVEKSALRVCRILDGDSPILHVDFTILGLRKESPNYNRGRKVSSKYLCPALSEVVVEKIFVDIRDVNGKLTAIQMTINWYAEDGSIGLTKTEIAKTYNKSEARTEERKRRVRQFDYLEASAEGTPSEPYITLLITTYDSEISFYKNYGIATNLIAALDNETDPTLLTILGTMQPRTDDPTKIISTKQSILYQIGTITLAEIEVTNA